MQEYKIGEGSFKEIKKQILARTVPIMVIAVAAGIAISTINSKHKTSGINVLPIIIPVMAVAVGFGLNRGINRQKGIFESYQLTLTGNMIIREQLNTPTVSIYFNEVREIVKNKNGTFIIKGKATTDTITVPAQIENYSELEAALNEIKPIATKNSESTVQKYRTILTLSAMALMICVYTVTNKIIVALSGIVVVSLLIWSLYEIQRSKNVDSKTKRSSWVVLIVLASIIMVVIMKLTVVRKT